MYEEVLQSYFGVRRVYCSFKMLPLDQVIEQTIHKEQKCAGSIIGISTSEETIQRCILIIIIIIINLFKVDKLVKILQKLIHK